MALDDLLHERVTLERQQRLGKGPARAHTGGLTACQESTACVGDGWCARGGGDERRPVMTDRLTIDALLTGLPLEPG